MLYVDQRMYKPITGFVQSGNYTRGWVQFGDEDDVPQELRGKPVLIKYLPGSSKTIDKGIFDNITNDKIPIVAFNSIVATAISKYVDPEGTTAEYYLMQEDDEVYICSPSFILPGEQLIEGSDVLPHQQIKQRRQKPEHVFEMVETIKKQLTERKVPQEVCDKIVKQFVLDSFKIAYMGMWDVNNRNWGILYNGIGSARLAPMYDLDLGFGVKAYERDSGKRIAKFFTKDYISGKYIKGYVSELSSHFDWFGPFLSSFFDKMSRFNLAERINDIAGSDISTEQVEYYMRLLEVQNKSIEMFLKEQKHRDGNNRSFNEF